MRKKPCYHTGLVLLIILAVFAGAALALAIEDERQNHIEVIDDDFDYPWVETESNVCLGSFCRMWLSDAGLDADNDHVLAGDFWINNDKVSVFFQGAGMYLNHYHKGISKQFNQDNILSQTQIGDCDTQFDVVYKSVDQLNEIIAFRMYVNSCRAWSDKLQYAVEVRYVNFDIE